MRDGRKIGDMATAVEIAAAATDLDPVALRAAAISEPVHERVAISTQHFFDHQLSQRPSFIVESDIGDKAVFSGLWKSAPLIASLENMLEDHARYTAHAAHFGRPPEN
jgi:predicted DsbA family dithiol-disulfide isomerase